MKKIERIAVLTSGGDAPGMNAAIRAVVRASLGRGVEVMGVENGYAGLMAGAFRALDDRAVGGIIQRGGTVLGSARAPELATDAGQGKAIAACRAAGIDGVVVIGGNGSQSGAAALHARGLPMVGVASTIDNDLVGCDVTIGATTAVDIAVEAIDRLKVTASSHHRAFLVEVMGRNCGYLALCAGIAGGAELVALPEAPETFAPDAVAEVIATAYRTGKAHAIIVVAEGIPGGADTLAAGLEKRATGFVARVTKLGHVQRGGAPGSFDRMLGSRTGAAAVAALLDGRSGFVVGVAGGEIVETPLADVANKTKGIDREMLAVASILAR